MRRRTILCVLLMTLVAGAALVARARPLLESRLPTLNPPTAHADAGDWPMFRHDPEHTGYDPAGTDVEPPVRVKWSYVTEGLILSSPAVSGGVVYVGSSDGKVYALEAATGALKWSYATGGEILSSSPAVAGGVVYVGSYDRKVYALDARTGALKWSYATGGEVGSSPAVAGGMVYVGSNDGKVYALEAATGALKWSYATGGEVGSSPAISGGWVYVGSRDDKVYALDAATGALKWSYATGNYVSSSPSVAGGVVYVGSYDRKVHALDTATGALKWSYNTGSVVLSSPALANGVVFVCSWGRAVYALDAATGALKWTYALGGEIGCSPAVSGGVVYIGSGGAVCALDAVTGALKWSYVVGDSVVSSPVVAGGVVYVGSYDRKLYALDSAAMANRAPSAVIDSITPNPASQGQAVSFSGRGTDPDAGDSIQGYNWRSDRDGPLSTALSFAKSDLSTGSHTIYFKVQDSKGAWSEEVSQTLVVVDTTPYSAALAEKRGLIRSLSALKYNYIEDWPVGAYDESLAESYLNAHSDPLTATAADLSRLYRLDYAEYALASLASQAISVLARANQAKAEALITWFGFGKAAVSMVDTGKCTLSPKDAVLNKAFLRNYDLAWTSIEKVVDYSIQNSKADERTKTLIRLTFDAAIGTASKGAAGGMEQLAKEAFRAMAVAGGIGQNLAEWYIPNTQTVITDSVAKANDMSGASLKGTDTEAYAAVESLVYANQAETLKVVNNADGYLARANLREVFNSIYDFLFVCLPPGQKERAISLLGSFVLRLGTQYDLSKATSIAEKRAVALVSQARYAGLRAFDPAAKSPYQSGSFKMSDSELLQSTSFRSINISALKSTVQDASSDYARLLDEVSAAAQAGNVDAVVSLAGPLLDAGASLLEAFKVSDSAVNAVAGQAMTSKPNFESEYASLASSASDFYAKTADLNAWLSGFIVAPSDSQTRQNLVDAAASLKASIGSYQQVTNSVQQMVSDIAAPPLLIVSSVTAPEAISDTSNVTINAEVTNVGGATAYAARLVITSTNGLLSLTSGSSLQLGDLAPMATRRVSFQVKASGQRGTAALIAQPEAASSSSQSRLFSIPLVFPYQVHLPIVIKGHSGGW